MNQIRKPNLFTYATSELSQDALLCWMIEWANEKYKDRCSSLHKVGVEFVQMLCDFKLDILPFTEIEIKKQEMDIDILCKINSKYLIIIEDKVGTKEHSKQLEKYDEYIKKNYPSYEHFKVYLQTGDQGNYSKAENLGYKVIKRQDIIELFNKDFGNEARKISDILSNYYDRLVDVEDRVQQFKNKPTNKRWKDSAWYGFFMALQSYSEFSESNWKYVPNPSGGFVGFWWKNVPEFPVYLQLEYDKLCIKLKGMNGDENELLRNKWIKYISQQFSELSLERPKKMRIGRTMTIAIHKGDYRQTKDGKLDLSATVQLLSEFGEKFEKIRRNFKI